MEIGMWNITVVLVVLLIVVIGIVAYSILRKKSDDQ